MWLKEPCLFMRKHERGAQKKGEGGSAWGGSDFNEKNESETIALNWQKLEEVRSHK